VTPSTKAQLQIHACVVLWGFTAIFGRLISLSALPLVWWRMVIVTAVLAFVPRVWRAVRSMRPRLLACYAGIGAVVAIHWVTFYSSIKLSNASVGATCMALGPVFLAVVEPWIARRRFDPRELLLGAAVVPGVAFVVGGVPSGMRLGIAMGALSALLVAIFGALNKRFVERAEPLAVTAIELGAGAVLLTVLAPLLPHDGAAFPLPGPRDAAYLVTLAVGCTLLPYTLALVALRHLSAFAAQLAVNLEPVYAIVIAIALLGEHRELDPLFYVGVAVILGAVLVHPLISRRASVEPRADVLTASESKGAD
jgi:drug/metabolite transporter (DMT)-like permease